MTHLKKRVFVGTILVLPWILDALVGGMVFGSLLGAALWGLWISIEIARTQVKNPRTQNQLAILGTGLGAFWFGVWFTYFVNLNSSPRPEASLEPENLVSQWIPWVHGGLLAAGLGIAFVVWTTSALWLLGDMSNRKKSWQRRTLFLRKFVPPLEVLGKSLVKALWLGFLTWGIGFFLAVLIGFKKYGSPSSASFSQIGFLVLGFLWALLGLVSASISKTLDRFRWDRRLFWGALSTSTLLILFFVSVTFGKFLPDFHTPVELFSR